MTNQTQLIDFSFSGDHSAQPSVHGAFSVRKRRDNGSATPGAAASQTRPSEKRGPRAQYSLGARREEGSQSSQAATCSSPLQTCLFFNSKHGANVKNRSSAAVNRPTWELSFNISMHLR